MNQLDHAEQLLRRRQQRLMSGQAQQGRPSLNAGAEDAALADALRVIRETLVELHSRLQRLEQDQQPPQTYR